MKHYIIGFLMLLSSLAVAQKRNCAQPAHTAKLQLLQGYEALKVDTSKIGRNIACDSLIVPVAIHVQGTSTTRLCLQNFVHQQIKILNDDFQGKNADLSKYIVIQDKYNIKNGSSCIRFVLADRNHPAGYGLVDGMGAITVNQAEGDWEYKWKDYLNIFIFDIGDNILGYSPLGGRGKGDGVVIAKFAFGGEGWCGDISQNNNFVLGRTLTHEVAHYFGLSHIWGDQMGCSFDDGIQDTPPQLGPNYGCPNTRFKSCDQTDLAMNFLDYANDECMYMFTAGQVRYMEAYLRIHLSHLVNNAFQVIREFEKEEIDDTIELIEENTGEESTNNNTETQEGKTNWLKVLLICLSAILIIFFARKGQE